MRLGILALVAFLVAAAVRAQTGTTTTAASPFERVSFLLGDWVAGGATELGNAEGVASFAFELDKHVMVRRSWVKYGSGSAAGTRHEDLLVIYVAQPGSSLGAIFFDGEGHVIHYNVTTPSTYTAVFESDPSQPGPRYRLTHAVKGQEMETKFEIAMPGQREYQTYVSGTAKRK